MSALVAIIYNSLRLYKELNSKNSFSDKLLFIRYDRTIRKLVLQIIFSTFILLFFWYLASRALNLELGYGHLTSRAGFGISHSFLSDYTSNQSRWDAYIVGVINTIRVSLVGIALATLLGVLMGIARLSKNFLVRSIATGYVEFLRNTPLLIQIIFWQLVFLQFPQISKAWTFGGFSLWSNRGILLPLIKSDENGRELMDCGKFDQIFLTTFIHKTRKTHTEGRCRSERRDDRGSGAARPGILICENFELWN